MSGRTKRTTLNDIPSRRRSDERVPVRGAVRIHEIDRNATCRPSVMVMSTHPSERAQRRQGRGAGGAPGCDSLNRRMKVPAGCPLSMLVASLRDSRPYIIFGVLAHHVGWI